MGLYSGSLGDILLIFLKMAPIGGLVFRSLRVRRSTFYINSRQPQYDLRVRVILTVNYFSLQPKMAKYLMFFHHLVRFVERVRTRCVKSRSFVLWI